MKDLNFNIDDKAMVVNLQILQEAIKSLEAQISALADRIKALEEA